MLVAIFSHVNAEVKQAVARPVSKNMEQTNEMEERNSSGTYDDAFHQKFDSEVS